MEKPSNAINTIGNDPFFAKLFIIISSAIFLGISLYYYIKTIEYLSFHWFKNNFADIVYFILFHYITSGILCLF